MSGFAKCSDSIFVTISRTPRWTARGRNDLRRSLPRAKDRESQAAFRLRDDRSANRAAIFMRLLASTAAATHSSKRSRPFGETALHAATAEQHRDAPLDAGAKALAVLELPALLIGFALGRFAAAPLWNAHDFDALLLARRHVLLAEEAAIRSVQFGDVAEGLLVAFQRNNHVLLVDGISVQDFILRDQAARAFGKEDLVAELDRRLHFAALDEVGMGLENRIDLLGTWNLFAVEHAAARLIDHTGSQVTKVLDLLARLRDSQIGDDIFAEIGRASCRERV